MTAGPTTSGGLREQHKLATRRALEDAALRLFAEHGFDAVSVEDVAAVAGVSPRTFFRYFATKEQVLNPDREQRLVLLREAVLRADGRTDLGVAVEALGEVAATFAGERETTALRQRAAATSPALRGRVLDVLRSWEEVLAHALAERRDLPSPDLPARTAAAVAVTLWRQAVEAWTAGDDDLDDLLRRAYDALIGVIGR